MAEVVVTASPARTVDRIEAFPYPQTVTVVSLSTNKYSQCPDCRGTGEDPDIVCDWVDEETGEVILEDMPMECERCGGRGTIEAIEVHVIV